MLLTVLIVFLAISATSMADQPTINLGSTASFAVLAGTTITNTGPTTINGDAGGNVGLHPGTDFTGLTDVTLSGTAHLGDAVALTAKNDLITAYDEAAGRTPVTTIATELGGMTLKPGVYDSADGTFQITGTLTLDSEGDADAVFIFKTATTLITASDSAIELVNGARYCRIFWQVGSSATLGTNSHFVGHIFALTDIHAQNKATIQGQLLARNGEVTLDTNTITNGICATASAPTTEQTTAPTSAPTTPVDTTSSPEAVDVPNMGESGAIGTRLLQISGLLLIVLIGLVLALILNNKKYESDKKESEYVFVAQEERQNKIEEQNRKTK